MSWTTDATNWFRQVSSPFYDGNNPLTPRQEGSVAIPLNLNLSTAGRIGFFIDYSERSTAGTHTFYVARTHGSAGEVSVNFQTGGDIHQPVSGVITWPDGDMSVQSFTVGITASDISTHQAAGLGEHRIWALLSSPTGGASLQFNSEVTRAYGVVDDGTLASDTFAVFYDSASASGGSGTQASPYNNIYTALSNLGSKRYLYGKGTTTPDSTNSVNPNGGGGFVDCMILPVGGTDEASRRYIRNWSGSTWTITGGAATNKIGFYSDGGLSHNVSDFFTFKGIDFIDLDASGSTFAEGGGIGYFRNGGKSINVELCNFTNINGSTNTSGFNAYAVDGGKMWRCTADNIMVNGDNTNGNAGGVSLYYGASSMSYQRCEARNSGIGIRPKRPDIGNISPVIRFCIIEDCEIGIEYGFGSSNHEANYTCIQNNLIKNCTRFYGVDFTGTSPTAAGQNVISSNVFDNCGGGDNGSIYAKDTYGIKTYNNISLNCRKVWDVPETTAQQSDPNRDVMEYADYNHDFGATLVRYEYLAITYATSALLNAVNPLLAGNDTTGDPLFTDTVNNDYSLQAGSPALTSGADNSQAGIYLGDFYTIGAA